MRALGELWMQDAMRAQDAASACGYVLGAELRACGRRSVVRGARPRLGALGVIGDRAFHADARVVTMLAKGVAHGLRRAGMASCGKPFPGHGFGRRLAHRRCRATAARSRPSLADDAALRLAGQRAGRGDGRASSTRASMPARPAFGAGPQAVLRGRLGFGGAIFTDDLAGMEAARHIEGRTISPVKADARAGRRVRSGAAVQPVAGRRPRADGPSTVWPGPRSRRAAGSRMPAARRSQALLPREPTPDWDALMRSPPTCALALFPESRRARTMAGRAPAVPSGRRGPGRSSRRVAQPAGGKSTENTEPWPSTLAIWSVAPWRCSTCLTMARPRPVPPVSRERLRSMR